jgi:hypothetical protein
VAVEKLLDRLPDVELAVPVEELTRRPGPFHRALAALPVRFPPAAVSGARRACRACRGADPGDNGNSGDSTDNGGSNAQGPATRVVFAAGLVAGGGEVIGGD